MENYSSWEDDDDDFPPRSFDLDSSKVEEIVSTSSPTDEGLGESLESVSVVSEVSNEPPDDDDVTSSDDGQSSECSGNVSSWESRESIVIEEEENCYLSSNLCPGEECKCTILKDWIRRQTSRNFSVLEDEYYLERKHDIWSTIDSSMRDKSQCGFDPYPTIGSESFRYSGERDKFGRLHGRGSLYFPTGKKFMGLFKHGARHGQGELYDKEGGRILGGIYENDRLNGVGEINSFDGSILEVNFVHGIAHGPARKFSIDGFLLWIGRYRHGIPYGLCWKSWDSEGYLFGNSNRHGKLEGPDIVYVYPDHHTALIGRWENDNMKSARLAHLIDIEFKQGYPVPIVELDQRDTTVYSLDTSGFTKISSEPMLRDPYEKFYVTCKKSGITGAQEGLYLTRDVQPGTIVSFYNGVRFHDCHAFNDWDYNSYKIRLNEKKKLILDIPPESRNIENYCATLAHKVNHSFFPNANFTDFVHPRFGRILCVKIIKPLKKGQEVFCNYGYNLNDCPDWYKALHDSLFFDKRCSLSPEEAKIELKKTSKSY